MALLLGYRALFVYFAILLVTRILGKRELGQVSPFDFVVAIMLGELAVLTIENTDMPLWLGMVPIAVIVLAHLGVALISMKSQLAQTVLSGRPTVVIKNGQILEKNLASLRFNVSDLQSSLREKGIFDFNDVEFAVMENTGKLSVLPCSQERPMRPVDLALNTQYEGLGQPLIMDGKVQDKHLQETNLTRDWLEQELRARGVDDIEDVMLAELNTDGSLYVSTRTQSR